MRSADAVSGCQLQVFINERTTQYFWMQLRYAFGFHNRFHYKRKVEKHILEKFNDVFMPNSHCNINTCTYVNRLIPLAEKLNTPGSLENNFPNFYFAAQLPFQCRIVIGFREIRYPIATDQGPHVTKEVGSTITFNCSLSFYYQFTLAVSECSQCIPMFTTSLVFAFLK